MSLIFAATIKHTLISKQAAFDLLDPFAASLLIAQEFHYDQTIHHHLFLITNHIQTLSYVRDLIMSAYWLNELNHEVYSCKSDAVCNQDHTFERSFTDQMSHDADRSWTTNTECNVLAGQFYYVAVVKCERAYLKYITKFDVEPMMKNIIVSHLSFQCQTKQWAMNTTEFKIEDPFVLSNPQYYKKLKEYHENYLLQKNSNSKKHIKLLPIFNVPISHIKLIEQTITWQDKVIDWWNDWIVNGYFHKKCQLYLWGPSNTGKTTFMQELFNNCIKSQNEYEQHVYRPAANEKRYAWQQFNSNTDCVVFIDEFDIKEFNVSQLKKALAGEPIIVNKKGLEPSKITIRIPFVLISNHEPPSYREQVKYSGIKERLKVVFTG